MTLLPAADIHLNVAAWEARSVVNGPGERFVLWVQGCPFRCPGCINADFLAFEPRRSVTPAEMAERILSVTGIEGVTYSGGEPMAQADGLYQLSLLLRSHGLGIVCYTGYTLTELERSRNPAIRHLLQVVDLLIDGRYEAEQACALPWRGSANQTVQFLSDRYRAHAEAALRPGRLVEFVTGTGSFVTTGIFNPELITRLEAVLKQGPAGGPDLEL